MRQLSRWLLSIFLVGILMTSCSRSSSLLPINDSKKINSGTSFGQSFTALKGGLSAVSILLAPTSISNTGSLTFHLRENPQSQEDIAIGRLPLSEVTEQKYYRFDFIPQNNSQGKDYFLQVDVDDEGEIEVFTSEADSYLDGSLYVDQSPQEAQLGFQLEYDRVHVILDLLLLAFQWIVVLIAGSFVFILPGWAALSLLWKGWGDLIWISKLGLSCGLSLAIYPVFFLWTDLVGLHLGPIYAWAPPLAGLFVLGWKNRNSISTYRFHLHNKKRVFGAHSHTELNTILADIAFVIILGLIIISRFWVIRSLEVPLFGDSYQHTMITHLMVDNQGLFDSWEPYAKSFHIHIPFRISCDKRSLLLDQWDVCRKSHIMDRPAD